LTLLEVDAFRPEFVGQPVVLVQTEAGREGEIRAHADEHPAPAGIVHVEVVLHDPALRELEMPAIRGLVPVGNEDPRGFAGLEDDDHRVGRGAPEVGLDKFVAPPGGRVQEGHAPGARPVLNPVVELGGDVAPRIPGHELVLPVAVEKPDDAFGLLERLDHGVEQNPIEAPVPEPNATLVMLVERVHGVLPRGEIPGAYRHERVYGCWPIPAGLGPGRRRRDHGKINDGAQPRASAASDLRDHLHALYRRDIKGEALG
jgi:hypothetical protein